MRLNRILSGLKLNINYFIFDVPTLKTLFFSRKAKRYELLNNLIQFFEGSITIHIYLNCTVRLIYDLWKHTLNFHEDIILSEYHSAMRDIRRAFCVVTASTI